MVGLRKILGLYLVIGITIQSQVVAYAETTGEFLNRIYGTNIASADRTALESNLFTMENQLSDMILSGDENELRIQTYEVTRDLMTTRVEELLQVSRNLENLIEIYEVSLTCVDLDNIISARADLQNKLLELGIYFETGINVEYKILEPLLLTVPSGSIEELSARIHLTRSRLRNLSNSQDYGVIPKYFPVSGRISSKYGVRIDPFTGNPSFHSGIDIAASIGTPIQAWFNGTVIFAGTNGGYGNSVVIKQGDLSVRYAHLNSIAVSVGQTINQGQQIGTVGSTGRSTGPHLHLELLINGLTVDPEKIINLR